MYNFSFFFQYKYHSTKRNNFLSIEIYFCHLKYISNINIILQPLCFYKSISQYLSIPKIVVLHINRFNGPIRFRNYSIFYNLYRAESIRIQFYGKFFSACKIKGWTTFRNVKKMLKLILTFAEDNNVIYNIIQTIFYFIYS